MTREDFIAAVRAARVRFDPEAVRTTGQGQPGTVAEWDFASHAVNGIGISVRFLNPRMYERPAAGWSTRGGVEEEWTAGAPTLRVSR